MVATDSELTVAFSIRGLTTSDVMLNTSAGKIGATIRPAIRNSDSLSMTRIGSGCAIYGWHRPVPHQFVF
jgi:hypothetical protein